MDDAVWKDASHRLLEDRLGLRAVPGREAQQLGRGKVEGEFDDAVVEERAAHLEGMRHAHAVDLDEDVAGQPGPDVEVHVTLDPFELVKVRAEGECLIEGIGRDGSGCAAKDRCPGCGIEEGAPRVVGTVLTLIGGGGEASEELVDTQFLA